MELVDKLIILIVVMQAIYGLYKRVTGRDQAEQADRLAEAPVDDAATREMMIERARDQIERARGAVEGLRARAEGLRAELSGAVLTPLREAVERLIPPLAGLREGLDDLDAVLADPEERPEAVAQWLMESTELRDAFGDLSALDMRLTVIAAAARWQRHPALAKPLREAEVVATALLDPLRALADWPDERPICLPGGHADLDVRPLFPDRPVVVLDSRFTQENTRWGGLVDSTARTILARRPGLLDPLRARLPSDERPWLPRKEGGAIVFDLDAAGRAWLPTIAADTLAVLMMGPAVLRSAMRTLGRPDDPYEVTRVRTATDPRLVGDTPPADLRIRLMARVLGGLGAEARADALLDTWDRDHDHPDALLLPSLFGQAVRLPTARVLATLGPVVDHLRDGRHDAIGGRRFGELTGFVMGPGLWSRVRARAEALLADRPVHDDPRVAVAAALLAADQTGGFGPRLSRALSEAILTSGERRAPDPHYRIKPPRLDDPLTPRELIEAVVLRAAWRRPHRHPRRPGSPVRRAG